MSVRRGRWASITVAGLAALALGGCVTGTVRTDPAGGVVVRDGQQLGPAPVTFTDMNGVLQHSYSINSSSHVIYSVEVHNQELLLRLRPVGGVRTPAPAPATRPTPGAPPAPATPLPAPARPSGGDR